MIWNYRVIAVDLGGNYSTSLPNLVLNPPCKPGDPCHEAAPRGSKTGVQGLKNAEERSLIPYDLALAVCLAAEEDLVNSWRS